MSAPVQDFTSTYDTYAKSLADATELNKQAVFAALRARAIATVSVRFNGEGDSGQIETITAFSDGTTVALQATPVDICHASWEGKLISSQIRLEEAIEELCFDYLSQEHGGWENNDGGQGEFTFRVEDTSIDLEFQQFYTDSTSHSHTF